MIYCSSNTKNNWQCSWYLHGHNRVYFHDRLSIILTMRVSNIVRYIIYQGENLKTRVFCLMKKMITLRGRIRSKDWLIFKTIKECLSNRNSNNMKWTTNRKDNWIRTEGRKYFVLILVYKLNNIKFSVSINSSNNNKRIFLYSIHKTTINKMSHN